MHWIHHLLGTCGEHSHPSILWLFGAGSTVGIGMKIYWYKIRSYLNGKNQTNQREDF